VQLQSNGTVPQLELLIGHSEHVPFKEHLISLYGCAHKESADCELIFDDCSFTLVAMDGDDLVVAVTCKLAFTLNGAPVIHVSYMAKNKSYIAPEGSIAVSASDLLNELCLMAGAMKSANGIYSPAFLITQSIGYKFITSEGKIEVYHTETGRHGREFWLKSLAPAVSDARYIYLAAQLVTYNDSFADEECSFVAMEV